MDKRPSKLLPLRLKGELLQPVAPGIWRMEPSGAMRVGVHLVGTPRLLEKIQDDRSLEQAKNVAALPGVLDPVLTMPDLHQGYGFPIGGVAAFRESTGVISPGGVGYDINCGVRLLKTTLNRKTFATDKILRRWLLRCSEEVPAGVGCQRRGAEVSAREWEPLLTEGAAWAVAQGFGKVADLDVLEERGKISGAMPEKVSDRAKERGTLQLGTLGSGNHFVELQYVEEIFDREAADAFGLFSGQVTVMIHTGSRGLGYQVCADYLESAWTAGRRLGTSSHDRELAAVPILSPEGKSYYGAMASAANFAFANRQVITHRLREILDELFAEKEAAILYDVCHNIAKFETVSLGGTEIRACIHRKGATRAYPPKHPLVPPSFREVGQPVIVPGDMGRCSYVLKGKKEAMERTFGSACHGAGRELSRSQAKKQGKGRDMVAELAKQGIHLRAAGPSTALEEMSEAYKDVTEVVRATADAGIAGIVAKLRPIAVFKG